MFIFAVGIRPVVELGLPRGVSFACTSVERLVAGGHAAKFG